MLNCFTKQELRNEAKTKLSLQTEKDISELSKVISSKVFRLIESYSLEQILAYWPVNYEVQIQSLLDNLLYSKHNVFLPRILNNNKMSFFKFISSSNLIEGSFKLKEPKSDIEYNSNKTSAIIIPGLVFSSNKGFRIGHGKGFYDIFLSDKSILKIGICFDFQIIDDFPVDSHDVGVNILISDKRELYFDAK